MSTNNPRALGVAEEHQVVRADINTTVRGDALVTSVHASNGLEYTYTGIDAGTGDVTIKLPVITESAGKTFTAVIVDNYGRVVGGTEGSITGDYILLDPASRQAGGFVTDTGDVTTLVVMDLTATTFNVGTLNLTNPLPVSSGGTGATIVGAHQVFIGPATGSAAPGFRILAETDIPEIAFSKISVLSLPSTLNGYGITDTYTKLEGDARYAALVHTHSGYEAAIASGTSSQYYRGDKSWQDLNADAVAETVTRKYFSDSLARLSISKSGTNLTYDNTTGIIGFVAIPDFTQINISTAPTLDAHVVTKAFLTSELSAFTASRYVVDEFVVSDVNTKDYVLSHAPIADSLVVSLNGLVETYYTIVTTTTLRLDAGITLGIGDVITATYNY